MSNVVSLQPGYGLPRGVDEMANVMLNIMKKVVVLTDPDRDTDTSRGETRIVFTTRREIDAKSGRVVLVDDMNAMGGLAKALGKAYYQDMPCPDEVPLLYVADYGVFVQSLWLSNVIPRALSVATYRYFNSMYGLIDPAAPDFTSQVFLATVDNVIDDILCKPSCHHDSFAGLPQPDGDLFLRTFGHGAPDLIIQEQMWTWTFDAEADTSNTNRNQRVLRWVTMHEELAHL